WLLEMLARRGHRHVFPVLAQAAPDGDFPTVAFPNPEEKGALDLAYALGRDKYAELIVANDPDADRLAAAVRDDASDTGYRPLSGNELGLLLGDWLLSEGARRGALPERSLVVTTIVSTTALEALAAARGARYREVLTGFKWILDAAFEGAERGETFVFGFEEALGYCCGRAVRDKDGIGAAAVLMELAAALKARGKTLLDRLDELALEIGVTATDQVAVTLAGADGIARIGRVMAAIRAEPPEWIGGVAVRRSRDLASAADAEAAGLPGGDVLTYWLEGGGRVVMRPSGTEPKLKCYLEASAPVGDAGLDAARADAKALVGRLAAWVRARIDQIP
ncbi:MAG: phospho-sugar mutase, partial [Myxococcales bacterium]|nr:phospho-sugar mutase [Myxococcales bacterium]